MPTTRTIKRIAAIFSTRFIGRLYTRTRRFQRTDLLGFAQNVHEMNTVRNRSRQRPGSLLKITRLLAQAVPYQIDSSRTIWTFWARRCLPSCGLVLCSRFFVVCFCELINEDPNHEITRTMNHERDTKPQLMQPQ